ncbi:unnamed protein product [Cylindrotheca closterium]|uniref:Uncharacterized protein n=1 Tax=Cylindrotheca closterium TaxID=2856 RepID=A0AAD2CY27_9STRA|nr:unnamed protein product [Cylindrotheca closterium]
MSVSRIRCTGTRQASLWFLLVLGSVATMEAFAPVAKIYSPSMAAASKSRRPIFLPHPLSMYLGEEGPSMRNENGTPNQNQSDGVNNTTDTIKSSNSSSIGVLSNLQRANGKPYPNSGGNFGDIMSPKSTDANILFRDGLVTSESYSLAEVYGISHPMDRIAVTANGNLQRIVSSYYDAPVEVTLKHCNQIDGLEGGWDRRVDLSVFDQVFCQADSTVQVHNAEWRSLVQSGNMGLGQLFRYQNVLPEFILHAAGPTAEGGFWRNYTLECSSMTCLIHEEFCPNIWDLSPPPTANGGGDDDAP